MFTSDLSQRLASTLAAVEVGDKTDDVDIETLAELASIAFDRARADGQFGGVGSGPMSVRSLHDQPVLDPVNDPLMVAHVREIMRHSEPAMPMGSVRSPGRSNVPYEDRGKTVRDASGLTPMGVIQTDGGFPPIPGGVVPPFVAQWIPTGLWALQTIGKILAKRRAKRAAK